MFDIDKFFLSRLYINSNGSTEFKEGTHEWHANRLINAYLAVLKDSPNSFQDLNGSIDNDTSLLTDVRDDLREGQKNKTLLPYSAYTLRSQSATKNVFIAGKFGIGPFALNNNMHILMQLYGVKFAEGENIMSNLGLTKLGGFTDRYGRSILSWFSGLINAHVDAAKDPWIPELNVNKYTYNLVSVLMHSGLGKDTFYFTTQPIMRQLATAYENASGVYMSDQSKSKSKVQQEAEEEVIKNMIDVHWNKQLLEDGVATEQTFSFSSYNAAVKAYWKTRGYIPQDAIKALFEKDCQIMRQIAKKHIGEPGSQFLSVEDDQTSYWLTIDGQEYNLSAFDVQMIVVAANSELKPYAEALSKLVQHTKIDTKKQGKNLIEQRKYLQGVSDLFDSTQMSDDRLLFDTETLDRLYTDSYIQHQTKLATDTFRQIMANQMIEATDKFVTDVDRVLKTIGNPGTDPKVLNAVQKGIMAKIKSKFFFGQDGYCERHKIDPRSLVAGKNTMYDKLLTVKAMLVNDPKYKDLLDRRSGEPSNYLLRALVSGNKYRRFDEGVSYSIGTRPDTFMDAKFIQTLGFVTDESFNADDLSQAWDDLLQDCKYPELQQFARELVVYAFITSGDNGGNYDLFKYVPNTWRLGQTEEGVSYADHMAQQHTKYVDGVDVLDESDFEDVILNMWQDDNIVPKYSMYRKNFKIFESWDTDKSAAGLPVVIGAVDKKGQSTIRKGKAYIKVPRFNNGAEVKGQRGYVVYKRIGYGTSKANQLYPIYAMIDPRGEVFDKNERIFQHWQEDYSETRNIVEKYLGQILKAAELQATTVEDAVTKIADYILANKLDLQTIVEGGLLDENLSYIIKDINRTSSTVAQNDQPLHIQTVNFYEGVIVPDGSTVFVFGSNPEGVHGAGAAKTARDMFGAQTGVGEGMTGSAYALPTKDLEASKGTEWYKPGEEQRDKILQYYKQQQSGVMFDPSNISYQEIVDNPIKRTITTEKIVESIKRMYEVARQNPEKQFKVAYSNGLTEMTYNGYIGAEMIEMFKEAGPIPSNVLFSRAWVSSGMFDQTITQPEVKAPGTYDMPQQNQQKVYTENGKPVIMYRGYALAENREATSIEETIGHTAVDYDESLKGSIYFTSSAEEAQDYANTRTDKSDETFVNDAGETITQRNRHYTGDYAKVSRYALKPNAKVEHYKNMRDYVQKGANSTADVIILDEGTMWKDNTEYIVKNPSVLIQMPHNGNTLLQQPMEIWYGSNDRDPNRSNPDLSNLADRPFSTTLNGALDTPIEVKSVEHAFQLAKLYEMYDELDENVFNQLEQQILNSTSTEARNLGRTGFRLSTSAKQGWDEKSSDVMKTIIKESFEQNQQARDRLLATGNTPFTHTRGREWAQKFPKILMEVRDELRAEQNGVQEERKPRLIKKGRTDYENVYQNMTDYEYEEWKKNQGTDQVIKQQLIQQFGEGTPNAKLTELVFKAIEGTDIVFEAADLGEGVSGRFVASENKVLYNPDAIQPNTILHEAIHAATSYYLKTANRSKLPKEIQQAIKEIEYCYDLLKQDFIEQHFYENGKLKDGVNVEKAFNFWIQDNDLYGYTSPTEMIAEISKPEFLEHIRDFDKRHKGKNIFDKLISAILKLFGVQKEYKSVEKTIKDATVTLLTNPNKELMQRYADENRRFKENYYKLFNAENAVYFYNGNIIKKQILPKLEQFDETEESSPVISIILNNDVLSSSFTLQNGATKIEKGTICIYSDGPFAFSIESISTLENGDRELSIRAYSQQSLQSNIFETKTGKYGTTIISSITPVDDYQRNFDTTTNKMQAVGRGSQIIERDNNGSELIAPNGKPSNLPRDLYYYVRTDEFKEWFGDWTKQSSDRPLVKFYGPTMGKTTAAKTNKKLVDFDNIAREDIKKLAESKGKTVRQLKTESSPEYAQLLTDIINKWKNDPENKGKTLLVSNAVVAKSYNFDNRVSLPSRDVFVKRQVERSTENRSKEALAKEAEEYYDALISKWYDNPVIDDRYVSDIESVSKVVDENGEPLIVYHGNEDENITTFGIKDGRFNKKGDGIYFTPSSSVAHTYTAETENADNYIIKGFNAPEIYEDSYYDYLSYEEYKNSSDYKSGKIYAAFLNLRNPVIGINPQTTKQDVLKRNPNADGFISYNVIDNYKDLSLHTNLENELYGTKQIVVFDQSQIKLVTSSDEILHDRNIEYQEEVNEEQYKNSLKSLGEEQEDKCNGRFEELPF